MPARGGALLTAGSGRGKLMPTGAIAESWPRHSTPAGAAIAATSGTQWMTAIELKAGDVVANITFVSDSTAGSALTHQVFSLYDSARAKLAQSADDTSTAWAANSAKTLAMQASYTVPTTALYYIGLLINASTVPTFENARIVANLSGLAPIISGSSSAGLNTGTAPDPAGAITASTVNFYCYVS